MFYQDWVSTKASVVKTFLSIDNFVGHVKSVKIYATALLSPWICFLTTVHIWLRLLGYTNVYDLLPKIPARYDKLVS